MQSEVLKATLATNAVIGAMVSFPTFHVFCRLADN